MTFQLLILTCAVAITIYKPDNRNYISDLYFIIQQILIEMRFIFLASVLILSRVSSKGMVHETQDDDLIEMRVNSCSFTIIFQAFINYNNIFDKIVCGIVETFTKFDGPYGRNGEEG